MLLFLFFFSVQTFSAEIDIQSLYDHPDVYETNDLNVYGNHGLFLKKNKLVGVEFVVISEGPLDGTWKLTHYTGSLNGEEVDERESTFIGRSEYKKLKKFATFRSVSK